MKIAWGILVVAAVAAGCAVTDYPIITDDRGSYSGVIRTGHKAYIVPSSQVAVIWADGSDEIFSMVYQNQYGDQVLSSFNNYDPTASVRHLDQTFCDWRYDGCPPVTAWNPANPALDDIFDYTGDLDCSGARTFDLLISPESRIGECGDGLAFLRPHGQDFAAEFASLVRTAWRGTDAYVLPVDASRAAITFTSPSGETATMPIYGSFNLLLDDQLRMMVPMTPNARHEFRWLLQYATEHGREATATLQYGSFSTSMRLALVPSGLEYSLSRF